MRPAPGSGPDRDRLVGVALVLAAAGLFGSGPLFARVAYDAGMSPVPLLTWRYLFASLVGWLLVLGSTGGRRSLRRLRSADLVALVALGLVFVGNAGAYTAALETVPAGLVAIITYLYPALVAVLSVRFVRRLEGRRPWAALALSMTGVGLAVGGIPEGADIPIVGLLLALTCAICYALWIVFAARLRGERPTRDGRVAVATGPEDPRSPARRPDALASSAIMSTTTALTGAVLVLLLGGDPAPAAVPSQAWPALVAFGTCSALAVVAFLRGTRRIGAARASLVSTVEPVYTIVLATIVLGESLAPIQVAGGVLVVVGVLLAESGGGRRGAPGQRSPVAPEAADRATV